MAVAQEQLEEQTRSVKVDLTLDAKNMLIAAGMGASNDSGRPIICGMEVTLHSDGRLEAASTDSYIMVHREVQLPSRIGTGKSPAVKVVVNAGDLKRALSLARRTPKSPLTDSKITFSTAGVTIDTPSTSMTVRAIEGEYPDWRRIAKTAFKPNEVPPSVIFNPALMHRIGMALDAMGEGLRVDFSGEMNPFRLRAYSSLPESGNWALQMPIRDSRRP